MRTYWGMAPSLAAAAALALAGCGSSGGSTTTTSSSQAGASSPSASASASQEAAKGAAKFGSTLSKDGISVTIGAPVAAKPSNEYVTDGQGKKLTVMSVTQVTVKNDSTEPLSAMSVNTQATSGDRKVEKVFDSGAGIDLPTVDVLPGRSLKWKEAYAIAPTAPLDVQLSVNFSRVGVYSK